MGAQQILRNAHGLIAICAVGVGLTGVAAAAPAGAPASPRVLRLRIADAAPSATAASAHEKIAILDLGPGGADVRHALAAALTAAGLEPLAGDGVDAALAGEPADRDGATAAIALDAAQRAFGALDCAATTAAAARAIHAGAARQAAGLDAPELPRAWAYVLLCADRGGDIDRAMTAVARLRALGAGAGGAANAIDAMVPPAIWARYPAVDAESDRESVTLEVRGEVDGSSIWIDHQLAGVAPVRVVVGVGAHEIAAASSAGGGTRRGALEVAVDRKTAPIVVVMPDQVGPWTAISERVARWRKDAHVPAAGEIAALLVDLDAHVAIVRRDDDAVVWTRFARAEPPHLASGGTIMHPSAAGDIAALIHTRVAAFNDHAPDPDEPLLTETPAERTRADGRTKEPTKWWVYATIAGALVVGAIVVYAHDSATDTQHVELHYP